MKNILVYTCTLILLGFTAQAQLLTVAGSSTSVEINNNITDDEPRKVSKRKIPSNILEAFNQNFQNVKKAKWRIENPDLYAADFINEQKENVSAYFNSQGVLLEISTLKDVENISASLLQQINSKLNNPEVADLVEVKDLANNEVFYVLNVFVDKNTVVEHHLDTEGNLIDEEKSEEVSNTNNI